MRKIILFVLIAFVLSGCTSGSVSKNKQSSEHDKKEIVCTIFPVFDWLENIIADRQNEFSVTLLGKGADIHSYQPTAEDIIKIQTCDLLVAVGGESDAWVKDVTKDKNVRSISLMDIVRDDLKRVNHDGAFLEYDEHVWLSLDLAEEIVEELADEICRLDADDAISYKKNAEKYGERIERLDEEYERATDGFGRKTVIFADRFPFLYMMDDYDIEYFAAFPGCSSDTEASFETVAHLSGKVRELDKETLIVVENSKQSIAETIMANSGGVAKNTVVMNSCQSVDEMDADYIEIMRENLVSLKAALK